MTILLEVPFRPHVSRETHHELRQTLARVERRRRPWGSRCLHSKHRRRLASVPGEAEPPSPRLPATDTALSNGPGEEPAGPPVSTEQGSRPREPPPLPAAALPSISISQTGRRVRRRGTWLKGAACPAARVRTLHSGSGAQTTTARWKRVKCVS